MVGCIFNSTRLRWCQNKQCCMPRQQTGTRLWIISYVSSKHQFRKSEVRSSSIVKVGKLSWLSRKGFLLPTSSAMQLIRKCWMQKTQFRWCRLVLRQTRHWQPIWSAPQCLRSCVPLYTSSRSQACRHATPSQLVGCLFQLCILLLLDSLWCSQSHTL